MPRMLRPYRKILPEPFQSMADEATAVPVGTSILGGLVAPETRVLMDALARRMPENVLTRARHELSNRLEKLFSTRGGFSEASKQNAIQKATSDPVANALIGDSVEFIDDLPEVRGRYNPIFGQLDSNTIPFVLEEVLHAAQRGPKILQQWLKTARQGKPAMGVIKGHPLNEVIPHEATHASQDRFGVLSDVLGSNSPPYQHRPHEWEANYAAYVMDPAKSKAGIPGVLARGQRELVKRVQGIEGGEASKKHLQTTARQLNTRLAQTRPLEELLDIRTNLDDVGEIVTAPSVRSIQDPSMRSFMLGILGLK